MSEPSDIEKRLSAGPLALSVADLYFDKAVREIERLNEVLASIDAATNLKTARRRARDGRTLW